MDHSVLDDIKKLLGIDSEDDSFDIDISIMINSAILALSQIGIGPKEGYTVTSKEDKWSDYLENTTTDVNNVKNYIYLKTRLIFDPPSNSTVIESFNKNLQELEWRMMLNVETNNLTK